MGGGSELLPRATLAVVKPTKALPRREPSRRSESDEVGGWPISFVVVVFVVQNLVINHERYFWQECSYDIIAAKPVFCFQA